MYVIKTLSDLRNCSFSASGREIRRSEWTDFNFQPGFLWPCRHHLTSFVFGPVSNQTWMYSSFKSKHLTFAITRTWDVLCLVHTELKVFQRTSSTPVAYISIDLPKCNLTVNMLWWTVLRIKTDYRCSSSHWTAWTLKVSLLTSTAVEMITQHVKFYSLTCMAVSKHLRGL